MLLRAAVSRLEASFCCVSLFVRPDNAAALRLYRRHGFEQHAALRGYYTDGSDAALCVRWTEAANRESREDV